MDLGEYIAAHRRVDAEHAFRPRLSGTNAEEKPAFDQSFDEGIPGTPAAPPAVQCLQRQFETDLKGGLADRAHKDRQSLQQLLRHAVGRFPHFPHHQTDHPGHSCVGACVREASNQESRLLVETTLLLAVQVSPGKAQPIGMPPSKEQMADTSSRSTALKGSASVISPMRILGMRNLETPSVSFL